MIERAASVACSISRKTATSVFFERIPHKLKSCFKGEFFDEVLLAPERRPNRRPSIC